MAETVKILDLDVNSDNLIKKLAATKKEINALKDANKELAKSGEGSSEAFVKNEATIKKLSSSYNTQSKAVGALTDKENKQIKTSEAANAAISKQAVSIDDLTANNKELIAIRNKLNLDDKEHLKIRDQINDKLDTNNTKIKENVSAQEQQKMSIGAYADGILEALGLTNLYNQAQSVGNNILTTGTTIVNGAKTAVVGYKTTTVGMTAAQKTLTIATYAWNAALKVIKYTLIATGIGAFVVLLGSLVAALSKNQRVMNEVNVVLAKIGAAVSVVMDRFSRLGTALFDLVQGNISWGEAMDEAKESVKGITEEIERETEQAGKLTEQLQKLEEAETLLGFQRAKANKDIKELNKTVEDQSKTLQERLKASQDIEKIETGIANKEKSIAKDKLANMLGVTQLGEKEKELLTQLESGTVDYAEALASLGLSDSVNADMQELLDTYTAYTDAEARSLEVRTTNQNKTNTLIKEQRSKEQAAAQERIDATLAESKAKLELYVQEQGFRAKTLSEEIRIAEEVKDKKLEILQEELKAKKITETEYQAEVLALNNDFAQQQAEATVAEAQRELQLYKDSLEKKKEVEGFYSESRMESKILENNIIANKEKDFAQLQLDQGLINQIQYNDTINQINEDNRLRNAEAETLRAEALKEQELIDLENKQIIDEERFQNKFALESERLEQKRLAEVAAAEKSGADVTLINEKYGAFQENIEKDVQETKIQMRAQTLGMVKNLFGEESAVGKAFALAEIANNTVMQATKAFNQAKLFFANPLTTALGVNAAIQGGLIIATGAAQAAKVVTPPKFADGGAIPKLSSGRINNGANLSTPLSNGDDTLAYVGQGEVILNQAQQARAGGSRFFRSLGVPGFANGGLNGISNTPIPNNMGMTIDYERLGAEVAKANMSLPAPRVSVDEISSVQSTVRTIQSGANF